MEQLPRVPFTKYPTLLASGKVRDAYPTALDTGKPCRYGGNHNSRVALKRDIRPAFLGQWQIDPAGGQIDQIAAAVLGQIVERLVLELLQLGRVLAD